VVNWTIPAPVFTQSGIFKVFDVDLPADFVVSDTYTIDPDMDLVTGPGVNRAGDVVFAGYSLTTVVSMDTGLSGLSSSSFAVSLSADPKFINGVVATSLVSATIASNRVTLVWSTSALQTGVFVRVSTTSLVASGYPYELTAVTANKISVVQGTSCSGLPNPNPLEFQVCAVTMTNSSGALGSFYPTEPVTIIFFYRNDAFPGTATLEYVVTPLLYPKALFHMLKAIFHMQLILVCAAQIQRKRRIDVLVVVSDQRSCGGGSVRVVWR
jgi:hypothetical protein